MQVNLLEPININVALFGLGKNKGVTSNISYSYFCCESFYSYDRGNEPEVNEFVIDEFLMGVRSPQYMQMLKVADNLSDKPEEHRKFLRQIKIELEITAPRYFWSEFDTYKIDTTAQSESTMHTILKTDLTVNNFECEDDEEELFYFDGVIEEINKIKASSLDNTQKTYKIKKRLPESFLQCRVVTMNYEVFKNIYRQRRNHKLPEWRQFCEQLYEKLPHNNWIYDKNHS